MLCALILYASGGTYSLTSTPNDRFLRNFYHGRFIHSQNLCQKYAATNSPDNYFLFIIRFDVWPGGSNPGFSSNKPTHYLLDHGNFNNITSVFHHRLRSYLWLTVCDSSFFIRVFMFVNFLNSFNELLLFDF